MYCEQKNDTNYSLNKKWDSQTTTCESHTYYKIIYIEYMQFHGIADHGDDCSRSKPCFKLLSLEYLEKQTKLL